MAGSVLELRLLNLSLNSGNVFQLEVVNLNLRLAIKCGLGFSL